MVTGAAGGIGSAIVRRLARRGLRVLALDHDGAALDARFGEGRREGAEDSIVRVVASVTEPVRLAEVAAHAERELGPVYALVNAAGTFSRAPALAPDLEVLRRTLAVNLEGALACTAAFGASMVRAGRGRIVNVASIAAHAGAALAAGYAASKAGLVAATMSHARELGPHGVAVNAVLPGYTRTAMLAPSEALATKFVLPRVPLRRFAEPDEIAEVVEALVQLETPYLTGTAIPIDGGLHVG